LRSLAWVPDFVFEIKRFVLCLSEKTGTGTFQLQNVLFWILIVPVMGSGINRMVSWQDPKFFVLKTGTGVACCC
jgi:hypothetical protein